MITVSLGLNPYSIGNGGTILRCETLFLCRAMILKPSWILSLAVFQSLVPVFHGSGTQM